MSRKNAGKVIELGMTGVDSSRFDRCEKEWWLLLHWNGERFQALVVARIEICRVEQ